MFEEIYRKNLAWIAGESFLLPRTLTGKDNFTAKARRTQKKDGYFFFF
jgi:hypothetical protein